MPWSFDQELGRLDQSPVEDSYFALDSQGKWEKWFLRRSFQDERQEPWWDHRPLLRGEIPEELLALVPEGFERRWALRKERERLEREGKEATRKTAEDAREAKEAADRAAEEARFASARQAVRRATSLVADSLGEFVPEDHWTRRERVQAALVFVNNLPSLCEQVRELGAMIPEGEEFEQYRHQLAGIIADLEG